MSNPSRTYLLLQDRLGSDLQEHVSGLRQSGESWHAIANELGNRTDVLVTPETLRLWFGAMPKGQRAGVA